MQLVFIVLLQLHRTAHGSLWRRLFGFWYFMLFLSEVLPLLLPLPSLSALADLQQQNCSPCLGFPLLQLTASPGTDDRANYSSRFQLGFKVYPLQFFLVCVFGIGIHPFLLRRDTMSTLRPSLQYSRPSHKIFHVPSKDFRGPGTCPGFGTIPPMERRAAFSCRFVVQGFPCLPCTCQSGLHGTGA